MRIDEILARDDRPVFSFEFFPPKTPEGEQQPLRAPSRACAAASPPTSRSPTARAAARATRRSRSSRASARSTASRRWRTSRASARPSTSCARRSTRCARPASTTCSRCAATRPQGQEEWTKTEGGLEYSRELVELIRADYPFAIGAACFPETHIHATSPEDDLRYLKEKVDAGADFLITQLFFDNALTSTSSSRARAIGIDVPIVPGILPITNVAQLERITSLCGAIDPAAR